LYDKPDNVRKLHLNSVPITGGIIVIVNFILFFLLSIIFDLDETFFLNYKNILVFYIISLIFFLLGIFDDKFIINSNIKFIFFILIIISALINDNDLIINSVRLKFISFDLGYFSIPWTLICFLLFINALNMFDGYNLQSASYTIFFLIVLFVQSSFSLLILTIIIALFFFSILNIKSKSFLGDGGTYFLGFFIGAISIKSYNLGLFDTVEEIVLLMLLPGLDLMRLFCERIFKFKKSPFSADRRHLHHLLLDKFGIKYTFLINNSLIILPFLCGIWFSLQMFFIFFLVFVYFTLFFLLVKKN
jgi:UDP-GlcNAc:undecaprenyl-phosphate GlcNAc-1-phosphate transferase